MGINNSSDESSCDTSIMQKEILDITTDSSYPKEYPSDPYIDTSLSGALDRVQLESSLIGT